MEREEEEEAKGRMDEESVEWMSNSRRGKMIN